LTRESSHGTVGCVTHHHSWSASPDMMMDEGRGRKSRINIRRTFQSSNIGARNVNFRLEPSKMGVGQLLDKVAGGESRVCFMAAPMFVLPEVEENPLGWGPVSDSIPEQVRPSPCRLVVTRPPAHQDGRDVKSPCAEYWRLPKPHRAHRTHLARRTCTRDSLTHFIIWHRTDSSRTHHDRAPALPNSCVHRHRF